MLLGLTQEPGSQYFAKIHFWKYPESRIERSLLDLLDLTLLINWDKSKGGPAPKTPRPYNTDNNQITASPVSLERAKQLYKIKTTTRTDEEIKERNRVFIEQQKHQE